MAVSVNENAAELVDWGVQHAEKLGILVEKHHTGATIIDLGVKAKGGFLAGEWLTEVSLGGLGKASITHMAYDGVIIPSIQVATDSPIIAGHGSQYAGWQIKTSDYAAVGSGPARALALKPKDIYQKIHYKDRSDKAVIVLEAERYPTDGAIQYIARGCGVDPANLYALVAPISSLTGSVQISGRVIEVGIHRLTQIGFDVNRVLYGCGYAPIAPIHPEPARVNGRTNDAILYGGVTYYSVEFDDDAKLKEIVERAPSSRTKGYGKSFYEAIKAADFDFYRIDPDLYAPAVFAVSNVKTGVTHTAGKTNAQLLKQTIGWGS